MWHLHGHDFWVLGCGDGVYDHARDSKTLNTVNLLLRNTVVLFPHGLTVLRFVADNPGVWAFHCIEPHPHLGMGVIFGRNGEAAGAQCAQGGYHVRRGQDGGATARSASGAVAAVNMTWTHGDVGCWF